MRIPLASFILLLAASALPAQSPATAPADEVQRQVAVAIAELAHPSGAVRAAASRKLWELGALAEPALRQAADDPDPEVSSRAKEILADFKFGVLPDTPQELAALVRTYRSGDADTRRRVITELAEKAPRTFPTLIRLARAESDAALRDVIINQLSEDPSKSIHALLGEADYELSGQLIERWAQRDSGAFRHLAAWHLLRGTLDARIAQAPVQKNDKELLAYLHRARGDLRASIAAAQNAENPALLDQLRFEARDWSALARSNLNQHTDPLERLAFMAAYQLRAGLAEELDKTLKVLAAGPRGPANDREETFTRAEALLVCGRPDQAIDLLADGGDRAAAFDLLVARQQYGRALELAAQVPREVTDESLRFRPAHARVLYQLGLKAEANRLLDEVVEDLRKSAQARLWHPLLQAEVACGRRQHAIAHTVEAMAKVRLGDSPAYLLDALVRGRGEELSVWTRFFARDKQPGAEPLAKAHELVTGRTSPEHLARALRDAGAWAQSLDPAPREEALRTMGQTLLELGNHEAGIAMLEQAAQVSGDADDMMRLGRAWFELKRLDRAASAYARAGERDPTLAAAHWLHGHCLIQLGRAADGKRLIAQAELLPLASEERRWALARELDDHGLKDAALAQHRLILRTGEFSSWYINSSQRILGFDHASAGRYAQAAEALEQTVVSVLSAHTRYLDESYYLAIGSMVQRMKALAAIADRKPDDALRLGQSAMALLPGDTFVPIDVTRALEKAGHKAQAAALLEQSLKHHRAVLQKYPDSAQEHNSLAWLLARVRKDLDAALLHARRGVDLDPGNTAILDTLAEVHFQRGDKPAAVALIQKCIDLEPHIKRHREALKRYQTLGPETDPPPE